MKPAETQLATVFAKNLTQLTAARPSITQVARDLGINRTQYNRYLSGEAHPRPEILARICAYFGLDARILLEPLDRLQGPQAQGVGLKLRSIFSALSSDFDHARMPDGLYQFLIPNMLNPSELAADFMYIYTLPDGRKQLEWAAPRFHAEDTGMGTSWQDRKLSGPMFQHVDGVSLLISNPVARLMMHWFVSPGYRGAPHVHTGYATMSQTAGPGKLQIAPLILRKLPTSFADILRIRRAQPKLSFDTLPEHFAAYLRDWRPEHR